MLANFHTKTNVSHKLILQIIIRLPIPKHFTNTEEGLKIIAELSVTSANTSGSQECKSYDYEGTLKSQNRHLSNRVMHSSLKILLQTK
jgi:hypothetical protein